MKEILFTCPRCDKAGYTRRGLRAHYCPAVGAERGGKYRLPREELEAALAAQEAAAAAGKETR